MTRPFLLSSAAALCLSLGLSGSATADHSRFNSLANLPFEQNRSAPKTAKTLMEELAFQQATQAYLWAMPLINTLGMKFGPEEAPRLLRDVVSSPFSGSMAQANVRSRSRATSRRSNEVASRHDKSG